MLWIIILALLGIAAVVFGIYYNVTTAAENWYKASEYYGKPEKIILSVCFTVYFITMAVMLSGCFISNGTLVATGLVFVMASSITAAYMASPFRFIIMDGASSSNGCSALLYYPLILIVNLISMIIIMLVAWVFALLAVLRGSPLWAKILIILGALLVIALAGLVLFPILTGGTVLFL